MSSWIFSYEPAMFRYLSFAFRALARQRLHTAINVLGLGVGLAAALLVIVYVRFEMSYDEFQPNTGST